MASPEKFVDYEFLDDGLGQDIQWTAPSIAGVTAAPTLNYSDGGINGGWIFEWPATLGALYGARKVFPATRDLSSRRFVWASGYTNQYATVNKFAHLVDGGLRFLLVDSTGAYKGWTIYGRDISGDFGSISYNPPYAFGSFRSMNGTVDQMWWCIDLERTPDYSSGTLDLADIVALEIHVQNNAEIFQTDTGRFACGYICASTEPTIRAGEVADPADFSLIAGTLAGWNTTTNLFYPGGARQTQTLTPTFDGANGQIYNTVAPIHVGDGSTATYVRQGRGQLATQMSLNTIAYRIAQGETPELLGPYLPAATGRTHTINQSASDDVEISDFTWSGYDNPDRVYEFEVKGSSSGSCSLLRNSFFRAGFVKLRHAQTIDCLFDACNLVEITADTGMTDATIRNAPAGSSALRITGAAGDYSGIVVRLNNPSATHDIALGSGGAGTYDLSGVTVPSGYTLKIHNDSATNAITVVVPSGLTTSTSTAGGTITIQQPPQTFTISGIISGSRLRVYNTTTATEIVNQVVSGTSYAGEYSEGGDFSEGDSVNVRLTYVDGTSAKAEFSANAIAGASGWSLLAEQVDNDIYNSFGIDGSTITQFQADYLADQVDVVTGVNFNISQFYAWWVYNLTTENGIRDFFGGITALDEANIRINTGVLSLYLDNSTNTNIRQLDNRRFFRSDGAYPVLDPTSGGGGIDVVWRNQIFIAETGVSGLTAAESLLLTNGLTTINTGVQKASLLIPHTDNI